MLNKVCKGKMDKTVEKVVENQRNQDNSNSNMACTHLKFVSFPLMIDQIIQSSLQLQ